MTAQTRKSARTSAVDTVTNTPAADVNLTTTETTPTQTAPAAEKPVEKKRAVKSAPLDLSALTVAEAPKPIVKPSTGAGRKKADNSVAEGWLRESWDARKEGEKMGAGKAVTVPTLALGTLKSRLNMAAATLNLGCAIQTEEIGDNTRVVFAAKVRKVKTAKPAKPAEQAKPVEQAKPTEQATANA